VALKAATHGLANEDRTAGDPLPKTEPDEAIKAKLATLQVLSHQGMGVS
jgi:hypothetical protein